MVQRTVMETQETVRNQQYVILGASLPDGSQMPGLITGIG